METITICDIPVDRDFSLQGKLDDLVQFLLMKNYSENFHQVTDILGKLDSGVPIVAIPTGGLIVLDGVTLYAVFSNLPSNTVSNTVIRDVHHAVETVFDVTRVTKANALTDTLPDRQTRNFRQSHTDTLHIVERAAKASYVELFQAAVAAEAALVEHQVN